MTNCDTVLEKLKDLHISYQLAEHPRVSSIEECRLPMELLGGIMPRNFFLSTTNGKELRLLIARPDAVFRTSSVSKQAGVSRLSFASEDKLALMGTYPGAVSPLGLLFDSDGNIGFLMDEALAEEEYLLFHPVDNTKTVKISRKDFMERFLPSCGHEITFINMEHEPLA